MSSDSLDLCTPERGRGMVIFPIKPGAGGDCKELPPSKALAGVNGGTAPAKRVWRKSCQVPVDRSPGPPIIPSSISPRIFGSVRRYGYSYFWPHFGGMKLYPSTD